jgi:NAD-dependent SIR2 family protein deacetylase
MGAIKGVPKKFYCYICKIELKNETEFKRHMETHFENHKCPICGMKTGRLSIHLEFYHIRPNRTRLLHRDLAILVKEVGSTSILNIPELKLSNSDKNLIRDLVKKL